MATKAKKKAPAKKKAVAKKAARAKTTARTGSIRAQLEALYQKHGYADGKVAALKAGLNKHTVQRQMWLISKGLSSTGK
jgi:hypothetical protein